tara:strand:- start:427 stop:942 length:516 start_codon:yes stop_codon:yes gene_type:complete
MYEYFVEVPNFKYDREQLLKYQQGITDWRPNVHYTKAGIDTGKRNSWFDYYPDKNINIIKDIENQIKINLNSKPFKFTRHLPGGKLPWHIDPQRECVFMIPITLNNEGLQWIDGKGNIVCEHIYTCPTVINAKIMHGCQEITKERIFLQVDIPCSWTQLTRDYKYIFNMPA